jgi:tRNA dimethylallyltransferase
MFQCQGYPLIPTKTDKPNAVFLMGPTASGKTALAIELVKHFPFEIISVDSALVYKGMDIGTAKPSAAELVAAPHRLIDLREPNEPYSAADFRDDALASMADITAAGKIPLLVGGTMLYFRALLSGIAELPGADDAIRQEIMALAQEQGWPYVHQKLSEVDPETAARLHPNDSQRLQRALEVYKVTGKPLSYWHQQQDSAGNKPWSQENIAKFPYNVVSFAVCPAERATLHQRIADRFSAMLAQGFVDEVAGLIQRGDLVADLPSIKAVGYRQVWDYLAGKYDYEEMVARGMAATRQLAKRQITWLRSWPDVIWLESDDSEKMWQNVLKILSDTAILR